MKMLFSLPGSSTLDSLYCSGLLNFISHLSGCQFYAASRYCAFEEFDANNSKEKVSKQLQKNI